MVKAAIFASGSGSNFAAIMDAQIEGIEVVLLICDQEGAYVIERAKAYGVTYVIVERRDSMSKQTHEAMILEKLQAAGVELLILAGYMRILSADFISHYPKRILNIHPSLLPAFPGKDAMKQAWDANVLVSGCSVHYVDEGIDTGEVIDQQICRREPTMSYECFQEQIHRQEHLLYPKVIQKMIKKMESEHEKSLA